MKRVVSGCGVAAMLALGVVVCSPSDDNLLGGGETVNEKTVAVFMPDGVTPAVNAVVKIIPSTRYQPISATPKGVATKAITLTMTDENGRFSVPELPDSMYNLFMEKDSVKAFQKSVLIASSGHLVQDDTFHGTGSFTAYVALEPNDMDKIQSVVVQILGSDIEYRTVDQDGKFMFNELADGLYRLKIETSLADYGQVFFDMPIIMDIDSVLPDTIRLPFNGIHVVRNLSSYSDTGRGLIALSWDATQYTDLLDYVVYRDPGSSITYSDTIYAAALDTFFLDTIYHLERLSGAYSLADSSSYQYKYRVAVRNNGTEIGETYGVELATAYPPYLVRTWFEFGIADSGVLPLTKFDTVQIVTHLDNPRRTLRSLSWAVHTPNSVVCTVELDTTSNTASDTLSWAFSDTGYHTVFVTSVVSHK